MRSIQAVMLTGKRLFLALLAVIMAAFACYLHEQAAARANQRKQIADLQQQLTAETARQKELRKKLQNMNEELERMEHLRRENRKQGDHWLPGELDRMRNVSPKPEGEV